jgi:hypothetical protein
MLLLLATTSSVAGNRNLSSTHLPLPPRISFSGTSGTNTFGEADAMVPLYGNIDQIVYGDATVKYGDDHAWLAGLGLGGRKIIDNRILGTYLFIDYNKSSNSNYYTVLSPGFEYITNIWDGHLNGYLPIGQKKYLISTLPANQYGINGSTFFRGHIEYDSLYDLLEDVGPGVDIEVGHTFPSLKRVRVFGGAYYFTPKYTSNVNGLEAGVEMPLKFKWSSLEVRDSYDNVNRNTFVLTLRLTFGGLDKSAEADIHDRMLDRIPRHLGNLNNGDGIPSQKATINTGRTTVVRDNIWFFNAGGTPTIVQGGQSCTYENPCFGLAQTQIDAINGIAPNANFYINSGNYNNPLVGSGFSFYNGQNVFGRTSNFRQTANGDARPLLNDSLMLNGNNSINNIRIFGNSEFTINASGTPTTLLTGALVTQTATGIVSINNSDVASTATVLNAAAVINGSATTTLNINNSTLSATLTNITGGLVIGAGNISYGTLNINNSSITVNQSELVNSFNIVFGVVNNENGIINIANSNINVSALNAGLSAAVLNNSTVGIGTINISDSALIVASDGTMLTADVFNQANNIPGIGGVVNINRTTLTMTSNNNGGGIGAGVFNSADSTVNVTNSSINSNGNDGTIGGIVNSDPASKINLQNNIISVNLNGTAVGGPIINGGVYTDNGGNQCFLNGAPVPC